MAQTQSAPPQHRGTRHHHGMDAHPSSTHARHREAASTHGFRPELPDVNLAMWVVGLLVLLFGIAGLYGVSADAEPGEETVPAVAVLLGCALVVSAALTTLAAWVLHRR